MFEPRRENKYEVLFTLHVSVYFTVSHDLLATSNLCHNLVLLQDSTGIPQQHAGSVLSVIIKLCFILLL